MNRASKLPESVPGSRVRARDDVYACESGHVVATHGPHILRVVRTTMSLSGVMATNRALEDLTRRYDRIGFVSLLEPTATLVFSQEVRKGIDAYVARYKDWFGAAAVVFEGSGFQATVLRSLVTGINLAARARHPNQVFASLPPAARYLSDHFRDGPAADELVAEVERLRALIDPV